eukprot:2682084-Pleurochrysis_carterae.AAC.2
MAIRPVLRLPIPSLSMHIFASPFVLELVRTCMHPSPPIIILLLLPRIAKALRQGPAQPTRYCGLELHLAARRGMHVHLLFIQCQPSRLPVGD